MFVIIYHLAMRGLEIKMGTWLNIYKYYLYQGSSNKLKIGKRYWDHDKMTYRIGKFMSYMSTYMYINSFVVFWTLSTFCLCIDLYVIFLDGGKYAKFVRWE